MAINSGLANIIFIIVLMLLFQPIKGLFNTVINDIFYHDRYNADEFVARFSNILVTTTDLRGVLHRASNEIAKSLNCEQVFFYTRYNPAHHITVGTKNHATLPVDDARELDNYVADAGSDIIITDEVSAKSPIHRLLVSHDIAVLIPLMRSKIVIGYVALGDQRGSRYTHRDIRVLQAISDELVIAIQNALSVQEVKDINIHLEQRIDSATKELRQSNSQLRHLDTTKDEFLSMASHQLRTPLTSVKGYLSMVLEGDAGKITKTQKQLLSEAYISSERMVHLIHDFLNVSRLQTGKFMLEQRPINLTKLIADEVHSLDHAAAARGITLKLTTDKDIPLLNIDESKIQQVAVNFIDNSLFYSHEATTIAISLHKTDNMVELRVKDSGIGVPKNEQAHLFTKFYRASNARKQRPDGTGVGLFLAKKVIDAHGGEVLFESKEGQGSEFGFRLPLAELAVLDEANQADNNQDNN